MKLIQVFFSRKDFENPSFTIHCKHCRKRVYHDPEYPVYEDLDSGAVKDYYCGKCARIKIEIETAKGERYDFNFERA